MSHDYILRKAINWNSRRYEYAADYGASSVGMEKELRSALIRNYAVNKDALFVSKLTSFMTGHHPTLLQRLEAIKKPVRGN